TGQPHSDAPLADHLIVEIHWSLMPFLAKSAPPFIHAMFGYFDTRRWWHVDHFPQASQTDASQTQVAVRTRHDPMFHDLCRHGSWTSAIVLGLAFLLWLLLFGLGLFRIGFDKRWRRRFLFFQLFNPSKGQTQELLRLFESLSQFLIFLSQLGRVFFCHVLSLSERSSLNSIQKNR